MSFWTAIISSSIILTCSRICGLLVILGSTSVSGYLSNLSCYQKAPCSTDKVKLVCAINKEEDFGEDLVALQWKDGFVPSEPTGLSASFVRNGDISKIFIHWSGPDDSSNKDLQGFQIEIGDGERFYNYLFDLRGNGNIFGKPEGMRLNYSLICEHWNRFSQPVTLDIFVTSLPKSIDPGIKEKFSAKKMSVFIPKYTYVKAPKEEENTPSLKEGGIAGIVVASIAFVLIPIFIFARIKVFIKRSSADVIYSTAEQKDNNINVETQTSNNRNESPTSTAPSSKCYTIIRDESDLPLMTNNRELVCPIHDRVDFQFRDDVNNRTEFYDSGFSNTSDYSVCDKLVMSDEVEYHRANHEKHLASHGTKMPRDIGKTAINFLAPSEDKSMDLEIEMLKINGFM